MLNFKSRVQKFALNVKEARLQISEMAIKNAILGFKLKLEIKTVKASLMAVVLKMTLLLLLLLLLLLMQKLHPVCIPVTQNMLLFVTLV